MVDIVGIGARPLLQDRRTVVIVDADVPPSDSNAIPVLITSPKRAVYWDFAKQPRTTFCFMPVCIADGGGESVTRRCVVPAPAVALASPAWACLTTPS